MADEELLTLEQTKGAKWKDYDQQILELADGTEVTGDLFARSLWALGITGITSIENGS